MTPTPSLINHKLYHTFFMLTIYAIRLGHPASTANKMLKFSHLLRFTIHDIYCFSNIYKTNILISRSKIRLIFIDIFVLYKNHLLTIEITIFVFIWLPDDIIYYKSLDF
ncbi:hypothetical protein EDEG_03914 [Edhazardia aedis USNM 41457]|uniref:Uncharacterized protein n=1 Tax=Edhazardia aedis (strain USNM 41457) TaxID=1003232 RepID=J9D1Q4_EDHAE|nr:hypothetical protein EDEG_03914 [Edhazardia aedis USNM 41457]|eukprot:EJW01509.1 hypothetical protein EDEG_03914 [Edhazardia aedis USNM 41457]